MGPCGDRLPPQEEAAAQRPEEEEEELEVQGRCKAPTPLARAQ